MRCDEFNEFYEHEHGYVFNKQQLENLIYQVRKDAIQECVDVCVDLANKTVQTEYGTDFNFAYKFAMDKIRDIIYTDQLTQNK